jgi:hemerythrin-like domain-containing protein
MTEILSMNGAIHAAVRRDLDRLEAALRVLSDGDRERVAELLRAWEFLDAELVHHHEQEDELVWPVLEQLGVDHLLLAEMESEHGAMREALEQTGEQMTRLGRTAKAAEALAAADSVVTTRAVVERHLTHEEQEVEPQMLRHKDSAEWKAVEKKLRAGGPVRGGRMFAWLLDDASPEVRTYLHGMMPGPVLLLLSRVFGIGYQRSIAPVWRT